MGRGGVQVQVLVFNNVSIVRTFILVPQQDGYLEVGRWYLFSLWHKHDDNT